MGNGIFLVLNSYDLTKIDLLKYIKIDYKRFKETELELRPFSLENVCEAVKRIKAIIDETKKQYLSEKERNFEKEFWEEYLKTEPSRDGQGD